MLVAELSKLPFRCDFKLLQIPVKTLEEYILALRRIRLLRRYECVAQNAGWVPTELEPWHFRSKSELDDIVCCIHSALRDSPSGLLLGATFRLSAVPAFPGRFDTSPVALEWVTGPAADPLQIALRLVFGGGVDASIELEMVSGAWSAWAETWATCNGTLQANVMVMVPLGEGRADVIIKQDEMATFCPSEDVNVLVRALTEATEGVYAVVCISDLSWTNDEPVWWPQEIGRIKRDG